MTQVIAIQKLTRALNATDPTRTTTLRNQFIADINRRYRNLMNVITESVINRDALGLRTESRIVSPSALIATPTEPQEFAFTRDPQKMVAFQEWLREQERQSVLEVIPGPAGIPEPFSNQYVRSSYQRGLSNALAQLRSRGVSVPTTVLPSTIPGVVGGFHLPFHQERVQMIYTRVFTELEGVTAAMDAQISEILASGLIEGVSPEEMARRINNRVSAVGRTRARLIARTETVETYNQAATSEFQRAQAVIGEQIFVRWQTAEDERVRNSHIMRNQKVFTQEDFLQLIGEPNCRCTGIPVIESLEGEPVTVSSASSFL